MPNITIVKDKRNTSVELLRLILMFLVMVTHADFRSLGVPTAEDMELKPLSTWACLFVESISIVAVNSFIFISGWYGIKVTWHKLFYLLFQIYFAIFFVYLFFYDETTFSPILLLDSLFLKKYWFIQCYLILLAFSPILNKFIETTAPNSFRNVLVTLIVIQVIWGWLPYASNEGWYDYGYSPLPFFFLYFLARYIREKVRWQRFKSIHYWGAFIVMSLIGSLYPFLADYLSVPWGGYFYYSSPFVIVSSCFLSLTFLRISFYNRTINSIALSVLTIYVVHCHECIWGKYLGMVKYWNMNETTIIFIAKTIFLIMILFCVSILLDRLRIFIWNFFFTKLKL